SAVRIVSEACCGPIDTATISVAAPFSFRRIASSTAISSNGFIDILTLASSTPDPSALTRTFTLKSTTRLTGTRTFILRNSPPPRRANYGPPRTLSTRTPWTAGCTFGFRHWSCRNRILRPHALEQLDARRPHHQRQQCADRKAADMRPPRRVALVV